MPPVQASHQEQGPFPSSTSLPCGYGADVHLPHPKSRWRGGGVETSQMFPFSQKVIKQLFLPQIKQRGGAIRFVRAGCTTRSSK